MTSLDEKVIRLFRPTGRRIQRQLDYWLADLFMNEQPGRPARAAEWLLYRARRRLVYALEGRQGQAEWWQGCSAATGAPLRVLFLGDQRAYKVHSPQYLQHVLFQPGTVQVTPGQRFAMRRLRALAQAQAGEADLLISEGNNLLRWTPQAPAACWRISPTWAPMMFTFSPGLTQADIEKAMRSQRNNLKLALKSGCSIRFSQAEADFDLFYERMYVPVVEERHSEYGLIDSKKGMHEQFHRGLLLLADDEQGRTVAGVLNLKRGKLLIGVANGVLDGDLRLYSQGVISLMYYHAILWAFQNGYACFSSGEVRPFQTDGLYFYKRRWGFRPVMDLWNVREWLFWAPTGAPAALDWLQANPPI